jgi:hypothetical protein
MRIEFSSHDARIAGGEEWMAFVMAAMNFQISEVKRFFRIIVNFSQDFLLRS